jgi:hypothetical protein
MCAPQPTLTTQKPTISCVRPIMSDITIEVPNPIIVVSDEDFEIPEVVVRIETSPPTVSSAPPSPIMRAQDDSFLTPYKHTERPRPPRKSLSAPPGRLVFEDEFRELGAITAPRPIARLPIELVPPPPPLCECLSHLILALIFIWKLVRPKTFWKNTKRSGVTGASYSPSSYLIRRSTFIAAGLSLDQPVADLSALGVESRIGIVFLPPDSGI